MTIGFTRSEASAIEALVNSRGRTLTRNQILDQIDEPGSGKNDRNVDFLINRIRKKLGDSARDPKFIATRYGEGYAWLQPPTFVAADDHEAYLVIGPVRGLGALNGSGAAGQAFVSDLQAALGREVKPDQRVILRPDYAAPPANAPMSPSIFVELTFFHNDQLTECVISAKSSRTNQVCFVERLALSVPGGTTFDPKREADRIAPMLFARTWRSKTEAETDTLPLPIAMHEAADRADEQGVSWSANDVRLKALRQAHPDDPSIKMMYATHLQTKYITMGREIFAKGEENCAADEAEIERLVLESLDFAQSKPDQAIIAAKLLYFCDRGYKNLSLDLANSALNRSTAIASSLAIVGQLRGFTGDTDAAIRDLRQALDLSVKGTNFYIYVLVLLCQALMAAGRRDELADVRGELYGLSTLSAVFFEPLFSDPYNPSLRAKAVTLMLSRQRASGILKQIHYVSARLFEKEEHRENALRTTLNLFVRRFGLGIATDEIRASVPGLFPSRD